MEVPCPSVRGFLLWQWYSSWCFLVSGCSGPSEARTLEELASGSLAQIEGELEISGLLETVEVIRDEWGIPHIYARNDDDLFRAQGYIMAQDRLWQMEMWRRWHEGRLAEIFGPEAFEYDLRTRLTMFRGPWDASEWTSYHPDAERIFTAYAEGVERLYRAGTGRTFLSSSSSLEWSRTRGPPRPSFCAGQLSASEVFGDKRCKRCSSRSRWLDSEQRRPTGEPLPIPGMTSRFPRASTSASSPRISWT